jgi:hypothetical protein
MVSRHLPPFVVNATWAVHLPRALATSTSLPIPTLPPTLAFATRSPTLPDISGLTCYSAPYGPIGLIFYLYLYFLFTRLIIFKKKPISWIFGGPTTRLKYHDINATQCVLPGLASCIITAVSFFGCADRDAVWKMKGYFFSECGDATGFRGGYGCWAVERG